MPRPKKGTIHIPQYLHHKPSNTARVRIAGKEHNIGVYGSPSSYTKYDRLITEWKAAGCPVMGIGQEPTVGELILNYWDWLQTQYDDSQMYFYRMAMTILKDYALDVKVSEFGPKSLKTVRLLMIDNGWKRQTVNRMVTTIKRMFKWATEEELIDPTIWYGLQAVSNLRAGRSEAPESDPIRPIAIEFIEATLPHLTTTVADMVRVQLYTGMRPGEVCAMTTGEIDTSGDIWLYQPKKHKTAHHGKERVIAIGPKAQRILQRRLRPELDKPIFSPVQAVKEFTVEKKAKRKSHPSCNKTRDAKRAKNKNKKRKNRPGDRYDANSYRRAIQRATERAGVPAWAPNQLRHTKATEIRKQFGLDASGAVLGHSKIETTQIYAERDKELAIKIARETG